MLVRKFALVGYGTLSLICLAPDDPGAHFIRVFAFCLASTRVTFAPTRLRNIGKNQKATVRNKTLRPWRVRSLCVWASLMLLLHISARNEWIPIGWPPSRTWGCAPPASAGKKGANAQPFLVLDIFSDPPTFPFVQLPAPKAYSTRSSLRMAAVIRIPYQQPCHPASSKKRTMVTTGKRSNLRTQHRRCGSPKARQARCTEDSPGSYC
jgi:hypothetical protein